MSVVVAVTKEDLQVPGYKLVHSIRGDGGQSDSICPVKAFSVGATYFPFTGRSSSSRLAELRGRAGGRQAGRPGGHRDSLAPPGAARLGPREGKRGSGRRAPKESPPALTRKRRSSPAAAAAHGVPPRCGAAGRAARGRGQLTGGTAWPPQRRPPEEPEPERAGPEAPLAGATAAAAAAAARLLPAPLHLQRSLRLLERAAENGGLPPPWAFW